MNASFLASNIDILFQIMTLWWQITSRRRNITYPLGYISKIHLEYPSVYSSLTLPFVEDNKVTCVSAKVTCIRIFLLNMILMLLFLGDEILSWSHNYLLDSSCCSSCISNRSSWWILAMEFQIWTSEFWWDEATSHREYGERIAIDRQTKNSLWRMHFWQVA